MLRALVKPLLQPRIFSRASWFSVKCSLNREVHKPKNIVLTALTSPRQAPPFATHSRSGSSHSRTQCCHLHSCHPHCCPQITSLVLVELKDEQTDMQGATASTLAAARSLGDSIVLLVAGHGVAAAAASAARLEGVEKVSARVQVHSHCQTSCVSSQCCSTRSCGRQYSIAHTARVYGCISSPSHTDVPVSLLVCFCHHHGHC